MFFLGLTDVYVMFADLLAVVVVHCKLHSAKCKRLDGFACCSDAFLKQFGLFGGKFAEYEVCLMAACKLVADAKA